VFEGTNRNMPARHTLLQRLALYTIFNAFLNTSRDSSLAKRRLAAFATGTCVNSLVHVTLYTNLSTHCIAVQESTEDTSERIEDVPVIRSPQNQLCNKRQQKQTSRRLTKVYQIGLS